MLSIFVSIISNVVHETLYTILVFMVDECDNRLNII